MRAKKTQARQSKERAIHQNDIKTAFRIQIVSVASGEIVGSTLATVDPRTK